MFGYKYSILGRILSHEKQSKNGTTAPKNDDETF